MHPFVGAALSLLLARDSNYIGPNGFDPSSMVVLRNAGGLLADPSSQAFKAWLDCDGTRECKRRRLLAVGYFVACAFDPDVEIRVGPHTWRGELGLAPRLQAVVDRLEPRCSGSPLLMDPDEGKWVSSCLMAFANMAGSHEYVWLRGSPPTWGPDLPPALRWTMGYPEGVFFADLLGFNVTTTRGRQARRLDRRTQTPKDLEQSFTLSLDLPRGFRDIAQDGWAPPNASNGRTLDFDRVTTAEAPPLGPYRVAENLGPYLAVHQLFGRSPRPADSDYPFDSVCVGTGRSVVPCSTEGAAWLRPLFAHAPRVVTLASAGLPVDAASPIKAISSGNDLSSSQRLDCAAGIACTGPFRLHSVGETPAWPSASSSRVLTGLSKGQMVEAVLRFDTHREGYQLSRQDLMEPFTAIIRYRSKVAASAAVEVSTGDGGWRSAAPKWDATGSEWEWLQVYPAYAFLEASGSGLQPVLRVRISGVGDGKDAPTLDLAGFVPGAPWCAPNDKDPFASVCLEGHAERQALRGLPIRSPASFLPKRVPDSRK